MLLWTSTSKLFSAVNFQYITRCQMNLEKLPILNSSSHRKGSQVQTFRQDLPVKVSCSLCAMSHIGWVSLAPISDFIIHDGIWNQCKVNNMHYWCTPIKTIWYTTIKLMYLLSEWKVWLVKYLAPGNVVQNQHSKVLTNDQEPNIFLT